MWVVGIALVVVVIEWIQTDSKPAPAPEFSVEQFSEHSALASRFLARFDAEDYDEAAAPWRQQFDPHRHSKCNASRWVNPRALQASEAGNP